MVLHMAVQLIAKTGYNQLIVRKGVSAHLLRDPPFFQQVPPFKYYD